MWALIDEREVAVAATKLGAVSDAQEVLRGAPIGAFGNNSSSSASR